MKKKLIVLFLTLTIFSQSISASSATSLDECEKDNIPPDKASDCIDILSKKVSELNSEKKTLANQIDQFNNQIQLTQVKISDSVATIDKLEKEISTLAFRIDYVNDSVTRLEKLLKERIVATYQQGFVSNLEIMVTSHDFSDLILRLQYIRQVQENDKKILANLQSTKANYANQKDDRETKQAAIEESKKKLEVLKISLNKNKAEKEAFLAVTKNNEVRYQSLLAQVQAELAISFGGGSETYLREVNVGDSIGTIAAYSASAGCSSGPHLHFEVHKDNSVVDPNNYLKSTDFQYAPNYEPNIYGTINPHGDLPWPVNSPIQINQGFGAQKNQFGYGPAGHLGIDMQTGSGSAGGQTIKAVKSGKLYGGAYQCGGSYPGTLYYARVKHDNGLDTLYLHIIPK